MLLCFAVRLKFKNIDTQYSALISQGLKHQFIMSYNVKYVNNTGLMNCHITKDGSRHKDAKMFRVKYQFGG